MKYKDLLVGDWFAYNGEIFIKSQKYDNPKLMNVSLANGEITDFDDNVEVEFTTYFFVIETSVYAGTLSCAPLGRLVQNNKCIYMRINSPDDDGVDTVIVFSPYNNGGRWFSSHTYPYTVETFSKKVEYREK